MMSLVVDDLSVEVHLWPNWILLQWLCILRRISFVLCIFVCQRFLSCRRLDVVGVRG
jgi:hypothetical protein